MAMNPFSYGEATTVTEAVEALSEDCRPFAGGTDLIARMKSELAAPERLVNLKSILELQEIGESGEGDDRMLRIGATATLSQLAAHPSVCGPPESTVLYEALLQTASPQLRHMATIGGNLLQEPRCWYYRNKRTPCWRKFGRTCFAYRGENKHHVILGGGPCYAVHPSDPAVALLAMDASIRVAGPDGDHIVPLTEFYHTPDRDTRNVTELTRSQLITEVLVPAPRAGTRGVYVKVAERAAWDFALAAVAIQAVMEDGAIRSSRVVLGGVATIPWRARTVEAALAGQAPTNAADRAAEAVVVDARPLEDNGYKVDLLQGVLREALDRLI